MKTWYSLSLGDAMMAHQPSEQIREAFEKFVSKNGSSSDLAIFTRNESEGRLHCEVIAYFSPAVSVLAIRFDAEPCPRPERSELTLLAGNDQSWLSLFPEIKS